MATNHNSTTEKPLNGNLFKARLAHFIELEKTWECTTIIDKKTREEKILGIKANFGRKSVSFESVMSISLPPFGELGNRLNAYTAYKRILHGGKGSGGEGRRQVHCLDWLESSEFSVDRLLFDCAEAIRFEQNYEKHRRDIERILGLQQRTPLTKNEEKSFCRAQDMARLAFSTNPGVSTAGLMLQPMDDPVEATLAAQRAAVVRRFGCILFPANIQPRQIKAKTPALLAFSLRWLFQHWPITQKNDRRQQRRGQIIKLKPPCYDLVADILNAIFPEASCDDQCDSNSVKNNLLKSIHHKAQFCGW